MPELQPTPDQIRIWASSAGLDVRKIEPLPGDVSVRFYARVFDQTGASRILSYYPPTIREAHARFLVTTELLTNAGVRVPAVLASSSTQGWALLEDLGTRTVYDLAPAERGVEWSSFRAYYTDAADAVYRISKLDREFVATLSPPLDEAALTREIDQTWDLFLERHGLHGGDQAPALRRALEAICASIGGAGLLPCHRDFMARNLMPLDGARIVVIDHQDLRLGPSYYDLASLLNDSLFAPRSLAKEILARFVKTEEELTLYRETTLQRTLKAVGTFVAFHRRGNDRHLALIAPTLARAAAQLEHIPRTRALAPRLAPAWRRWALPDLLD